MSDPTLVDQSARDRIEHALDETLFVEAGAGTGKTRSLVSRIVRLLATGRATADGIAAITFTEAAAAELRDRVRAALEDAVAEDRDALPDPVERARCEAALADLEATAIETIHAFCRRLLATYPLEAGLPPAFEVLDDTDGHALFAEQFDRWLERLLERAVEEPPLGAALLAALELRMQVPHLQALARALGDEWDRIRDDHLVAPAAPGVDVDPLLRELRAVAAVADECVDPTDRMLEHLATMGSLGDALERAADDRERLRALGRLAERVPGQPWRLGNRGRAGSWPGVTVAELRALALAVHEHAAALASEIADASARTLFAEAARFAREAAEERRRLGRLEFQDLLALARRLLATRTDVRRALRARYSHLLIDEFQDTDPVQAEIAMLLGADPARTPDAAAGAEAAAASDPGRLFFVGDPKQSIYRFRRADIAIYRRVQDAFAGAEVRLTQNFRSVPGVIAWANAQFAERFALDASGQQARYESLHPHRPDTVAMPAVRRIGGPRDVTMPLLREEEASVVIALLREVRDGAWPVEERGGARTAHLGDVAILARARSGFGALRDALEEAAIPHRIESRTLVYEAQEVRDLLSLLVAIDDPTDEVALVAALRSPALACGDDDLLRFRAAGGRWDIRRDGPAAVADGPVATAMRWLRERHERRWWTPLATLVDEIVRDRRLLELAFVDRRPRERWQRLRFVADQARAYAERPEATLRGLIDWLQRQAEDRAAVQERVVPEPDDDAVRIMTVHASKGLEFPIVVLVGLGSTPRRISEPVRVLWGDGTRPELTIGPRLATSGFAGRADADAALDALEQERLHYVAATRARDHLVLSMFHSARGTTSGAAPTMAEVFHRFAEEHPELCRPFEPRAEQAADSPVEQAAAAPEPAGARDRWIAEREALIARTAHVPAISATGLAQALAARREGAAARDDALLDKEDPSDETPPWRRGRAGTAIGRAVHSVLQTVDLASGDALESIAAAQATAEGVADRAAEVARLARSALASAPVRAAVESGRAWREVYLAAEIDGVVVDGFIDLLYEAPDGLVVVDYKTDRVDAGRVDGLMERYRPQALAYALALQARLGGARRVARCEFVFAATPGAALVRTVEVDAAGLDALRALVPEIAAGRGSRADAGAGG